MINTKKEKTIITACALSLYLAGYNQFLLAIAIENVRKSMIADNKTLIMILMIVLIFTFHCRL